MPENLCPIDDVPIKDSAHLCHGCTGQVRDALRAIPDLMDELAIMLTKQARVVQYRTTPSTSEDDGQPMVYSEAASRAKSDLKSVLAAWAKYVHEERLEHVCTGSMEVDGEQVPLYGYARTPLTCRDTTTSISGWLAQYLPWLRRQDIGPDLHREVVGEVNHIRRLIDAPPATQYIGLCGYRWDDRTTCTAELWCPVGATDVTCRTCGASWDVHGRRAGAFASVMDRIESPAVIARALGSQGVNITVERIQKWKARGKLAAVACDVKTRRPRYRLGDVMDMWHSTQASPHNSRRPQGDRP